MSDFERMKQYLSQPIMGLQLAITDRGDGFYVLARRLMFHWTLIIGENTDFNGYADRYCYEGESPVRVLAAIEEWKSRNWEGEPKGWRRHPDTGRRRNDDGDPESETIGW